MATATSKSQLFHYFPNGREDLLHAVARHEADQVLAAQQPYLADLTSGRKWQAGGLRSWPTTANWGTAARLAR